VGDPAKVMNYYRILWYGSSWELMIDRVYFRISLKRGQTRTYTHSNKLQEGANINPRGGISISNIQYGKPISKGGGAKAPPEPP
jgi:hypothetical protein